MKRLTMPSSSEWKLMTPSRPPGASAARLAGSHGARNDLCELSGASDWLGPARCDDLPRHALCESLLAIFANHTGQLVLRGLGDELLGARAAVRIHTHVERTVLRKAEAARRIVELRGGHTEIEQHAVNSPGQTCRRDQRA